VHSAHGATFFCLFTGIIGGVLRFWGEKLPPPLTSLDKTLREFHFRSMEASNIENDVAIQFLVGALDIHFAGICHVSCSVQKLFKNFMLLQQLRNFSLFGGKYDP
jgi:hypothetical protein